MFSKVGISRITLQIFRSCIRAVIIKSINTLILLTESRSFNRLYFIFRALFLIQSISTFGVGCSNFDFYSRANELFHNHNVDSTEK